MIYQYLDTKPEFAVPFNGWVADTARVIGDVYLGHQASVWDEQSYKNDLSKVSSTSSSNVRPYDNIRFPIIATHKHCTARILSWSLSKIKIIHFGVSVCVSVSQIQPKYFMLPFVYSSDSRT